MSSNDEKAFTEPERGVPTLSHAPSVDSSLTHVQPNEKREATPYQNGGGYAPGHGESALPEDKVEEAFENVEDDWEDDPDNARNWSSKRKWTAVGIVSAYTFVSPLTSSMMAPGIPDLAIKYGITSPTVAALTLSIFLVSFALGPLFLAPVSEMYGRTWVLHIGNIFTLAFCIGCAFAPTVGSFIGFRFLSGLSGSAPIAVGAGSVGDLFAAKDRASAMALFSLGPLIGPVVGPIAGGFIAQTVGVKWVFIVIAGCCAVCGAFSIPLLRETYAPVIRQRKAAKSGDPEKVAKAHPHLQKEHGSKLHVLWINLSRPITLLFRSLICFMLSLYMAFMYGIYYLMFATFAQFFQSTYGFGAGIGGLTYLGLGVGFMLATIFGAKFADQVYKYLGDKNGGVCTPEMRIPALAFGSLFVPIGLFWYGWSAQAGIHWIMPIIGTGIFGFGMMTTFLPIQLYLVDSFVYAASATSAAALFRSLLGFAFPLFGQQMFDALGLGGGNSLLAGLGIVLGIPFPIWLYYKGADLRARNPLTRDSTLPQKTVS
ncbi:major facilitator superfamily domain-containing protein [Gymnopilus junonius]|uniref:Major facilitator superfamily domain-containing protein n=1 Tax=Gymnopilus junonius TaxID=109634 RepID=A0A9P5NQW2_GYMJU|nr:major facilitator superfamily domain-containing protein [Gymnopilus junonius]